MNQATLFLSHLDNLSDQGKAVPTNAVNAENITLLRSVIGDFIQETNCAILNIYTQHWTLELGPCENIEIHFSDNSLAVISSAKTSAYKCDKTSNNTEVIA
ncbi:hypothetical protein [Vibrio litoralis]|uniref:hypothetical protein n=1 Tax=Vibrio litoralis TaxID=335972 RepID=UPI001865EFE0|nr:hypothetical protein [Vibrio litoralis]